jgi:hypothetical protein
MEGAMYNVDKTDGVGHLGQIRSAGFWEARPLRHVTIVAMAALFLNLVSAGTAGADGVSWHGSPIMQTVQAHLIFWRPPGHDIFAPGLDGNSTFEEIIEHFFDDLNGTDYFKIAAQYPATCGQVLCRPQGVTSGSIRFYLHDFTDHPWRPGPDLPLQDVDIQESIKRAMHDDGWKSGLGDLFFVFLGEGVQLCLEGGGGCSADGQPNHDQSFCAYHGNFPFDPQHPNNNDTAVIYAAIPHVHPSAFPLVDGGRCGNVFQTTLSEFTKSLQDRDVWGTTPNQSEADWTLIAVSHEFFESVTDPLPFTGWVDIKPDGTLDDNPEIGDKCNAMIGGKIFGAENVTLNGDPYLVQEMWSNDHASCVLGGPLVIIAIQTGDEALTDDMAVTAGPTTGGIGGIEGVWLKLWAPTFHDDVVWDKGSIKVRVYRAPDLAAGQQFEWGISAYRPSRPADHYTWTISALQVTVRDASGHVIPGCDQFRHGTPLARLTDPAESYTFAMPNCHY